MNTPLIEGEDFYYNDKGLMVLTNKYHLERGSCCGNWCYHCPYNYEKVPEPRRSILLAQRQKDENTQEENKEG